MSLRARQFKFICVARLSLLCAHRCAASRRRYSDNPILNKTLVLVLLNAYHILATVQWDPVGLRLRRIMLSISINVVGLGKFFDSTDLV